MIASVRTHVLACSLALLAACGGGSGAMVQPAPMAPAGNQGIQMTVAGSLTGTPSGLQFSGQSLDTATTAVTVNGRPGSLGDLQPGVMLQGKGIRTGSSLQLSRADVRPALCGPVTAVDVAGGKLTVLNTTVAIDALTILVQEAAGHSFTSLTLADMKVGDLVRVFGTTQTDGSILASRIERRSPGTPDNEEVRGLVSDLDATAATFKLGSVTVSYGTATVRGTLANGLKVEVEGTLAGSTFTATRVEVEEEAGDPGSGMEIRGPLTGLDATAKTFTLLGFKVDYSAAVLEGTLVEGAVVEVEGSLSMTATDTILATKVEVRFEHRGDGASDGEAEGALSALNTADLTLTVAGRTYWTDAHTVFIQNDAPIGFSDLTVGERVEVRSFSSNTNAAGQAYASRVEVAERMMH